MLRSACSLSDPDETTSGAQVEAALSNTWSASSSRPVSSQCTAEIYAVVADGGDSLTSARAPSRDPAVRRAVPHLALLFAVQTGEPELNTMMATVLTDAR